MHSTAHCVCFVTGRCLQPSIAHIRCPCACAGKRGDLAKARAVFEAVPTPNVWHVSALISAYANAGEWAALRAP